MTQIETPTAFIASTSELIVNIPIETNERQPIDERWVFQRFADWFQATELRLSIYINSNRPLLVLAYILLFVVSVLRIFLHLWTASSYSDDFNKNDKNLILVETGFSALWLINSIIIFVQKTKESYTENACRASVLFVLFCIEYFTLSYLAVQATFNVSKNWRCIVLIVLFVFYGFLSEKSPNALAIIIWCVFMCFIFECLIRLIMCKCNNPWKSTEEQKYSTKKIPIHFFTNSKYEQKSCAICLKQFEEKEQICQLNCHPNHIFHSDCTKEWLDRNHQCPYCRVSI